MNVAFGVVFGVFAVAMVVLVVVAIRWGVRRDRVARARLAEASSRRPPDGAALAPGSTPDGGAS